MADRKKNRKVAHGAPKTPEHFGEAKAKVIKARAVTNVARETGLSRDIARTVITTPLTQIVEPR